MIYHNDPKFSDRYAWANSVDPDQTAPRGAIWSGATLFFHSICIFWTHYSMVEPNCSNFSIITAVFWVSEYLGMLRYFCRFYEILRRHNYVTPTSYLELILTFKKLLGIKRDSIMLMRNRYLTGLEKLEFAASQVSVMQQELKDLQPELIKTSAETEKLMIKIEQDTVEVEAKKEVWEFHEQWRHVVVFLSHLTVL